MKNLNDFLAKIDKVDYTITDNEKSIKGLYLGKDFEVSYRLKIHYDWDGYPIQVIISVRMDGEHIQTWGCCDNEDNAVALHWFERIRNQIRKDKRKKEIELYRANELLFKSM